MYQGRNSRYDPVSPIKKHIVSALSAEAGKAGEVGAPAWLSLLRQSCVQTASGRAAALTGGGPNRLSQVSLVQLIVALAFGLIMIKCKFFFC